VFELVFELAMVTATAMAMAMAMAMATMTPTTLTKMLKRVALSQSTADTVNTLSKLLLRGSPRNKFFLSTAGLMLD
jgi:hypothetical protein